jgi:hypothetical protein
VLHEPHSSIYLFLRSFPGRNTRRIMVIATRTMFIFHRSFPGRNMRRIDDHHSGNVHLPPVFPWKEYEEDHVVRLIFAGSLHPTTGKAHAKDSVACPSLMPGNLKIEPPPSHSTKE